ncbi:MAG: A24 family peptidase [Candidatus Limnocylindrales bacterium]
MNAQLLTVAAMVSGALFGVFSDRLAARWPAHYDEDGLPSTGPMRGIDWRTFVMAAASAASFAALVARWTEPRDLVVLGVYFAALIVLAATDLDQKLLPDLITFPLMGAALVLLIIGWAPLLAGKDLGYISGIVAGIGGPIFLIVTDRALGGALGFGDVKLAVGLGLMSGISRLIGGFLIASVASSVVLLMLIAARRLGMRSAIPFGPILIAAGIIAALLP